MIKATGTALGGYHAPRNRWSKPSNEPPMYATVGAALDEKTCDWLVSQSYMEKKSISALVRRALRFEMERVKTLGKKPSPEDLDYGRV
jgi:hypothetical protein